MEPGGSLPHSQEPATCPYPEPAQLHIYFPLPSWHGQVQVYRPLQFKSALLTHLWLMRSYLWLSLDLKHCTAVFRRWTCGLEGLIMASSAKPRCAKFLWEKQTYVNVKDYNPLPPLA
jgi:hypothetical protein